MSDSTADRVQYCEHCDKETPHTVEIERDANNPPDEFIEAEEEGSARVSDCIFYANGDSEYRVTCTVCYNSVIEV